MFLAISYSHERLAPVFDVSRTVLLLKSPEQDDGSPRPSYDFPNDNPFEKILFLKTLKVKKLICGAISRPVAEFAEQQGLVIQGFLCGALSEVIPAAMADETDWRRFLMPGCCRRRRRNTY